MNTSPMNKERWVEVFAAAGLDKATMQRWHAEFERRYPEGHQAFLDWIALPPEDIARIRAASRGA